MSEAQSPSARIVAAAQQATTMVDARGRKISFRVMSVLDQARIFKAIGPAQSENGPYVRLAIMAASVVDIDGVPSPSIVNDQGVEAAISRLGDDGYMALSIDMDRRVAEARKAAEEALDEPGALPLAQDAPSPGIPQL